MDRDRGRDRRGDGEVTKMGAGESYRPSARPRSPQRTETFRPDRDRSPRRDRARSPPVTDSWYPNSRNRSPRRRSRTPPRRDRSPLRDNWRSRGRTPPRVRSPPRRFPPRDDDRRARSPPRRDDRRRSRSPFDRDRPPPRVRTPVSRRSPPPAPRGYRPRSRSPDRRDDRAPTGPSAANWRRRSPSPAPRESDRSGRTSGNTSRRSSPPVHPDRLRLTQDTIRETRPRSPPHERSPPAAAAAAPQLVYREKEPTRSTPRERSPARPVPRSPPRGPASFRAPPTGPSGGRNFTAPSPSATVFSRADNSGPAVPPSGPRGYVPSGRGSGFGMRGGRGSFGSDRVSRPDTSSWGAAPPSRLAANVIIRASPPISRPTPTPSPSIASTPVAATPSAPPTGPAAGIPTGPRAGVARPQLQHSSTVYGRGPPSAPANTGPRPHPAMAGMPQIIAGGRIDPSATGIPNDIAQRLKRKEEEAEILREELHAKQEKLRQSLKGWDKLSRDSASMALRTELSERHVRMLAGEGVGGAAF